MNKLIFATFVLLLSVLYYGCRPKEDVLVVNEVVEYDPSLKEDFISSGMISGIELIPLESTDNLFVNAGSGTIIAAHGNYIVVDAIMDRIMRFDSTGRFLNNIGMRGRGPNEYIEINNVQYFPDKKILSVYSYSNDAIINYSDTGEYISSDEVHFEGLQIIRHNDNCWYYLGFPNMTMPERVVKTGSDGRDVISTYLPTEAKILSTEEDTPSLIAYDDDIYVRESMNNNICRIDNEGNIVAEYSIDFGKYNIPDSYFQMEDSRDATDMLFSTSFGTIYNFFINERYVVIETMIQAAPESQNDMALSFAIKDRASGEWRWLNYKPIKDPYNLFATHIGTLTENSELIFLVDPYKLKNSEIIKSGLIENTEIIDNLKEDGNCVLVKCRLKTA